MRTLIYASVLFLVACGQTEDPDSPEARRNVDSLASLMQKKNTIDVGIYVDEAYRIFKIFGMPIRRNISKDGEIRLQFTGREKGIRESDLWC